MADRESCISRLWTPQHIIHAELGPASQKFSTTLTTPKNRKPGAHSCSASISPLTVITIAEPRLFPVSCCFLRRFSFISQRGSVFNFIPVDYSISWFSSFIFPLTGYLSRNISCTFNRCQCSITSTSTIVASTVFAAQMNKLDNWGINNPLSAFSMKRADIAPDGAYLSREKRVPGLSLVFCSVSFYASIKSAADICWPHISRGKRILLPWCSTFIAGLSLLYGFCIWLVSRAVRGFELDLVPSMTS